MGAPREGSSDGNRCWALPLWGLPSVGLSNSVNIFETLNIIMSKKKKTYVNADIFQQKKYYVMLRL